MKNERAEVAASRKAFDAILGTPGYQEVHGDDVHLERLLQLIKVENGDWILDLGTGGGYVAFAMAARWPECRIVGLDVALEAVARNRQKVDDLGLTNLEFHTYEGVHFPFPDEKFSGAICRYAFHHCPEPEVTVSELARVVGEGSSVVLSDPVPSPPDDGAFIEAFQSLQPDGHHCFHPEEALVGLFRGAGFDQEDVFETSFRGPRISNPQYEELLDRTPETTRQAYMMQLEEGRIFFSLRIMNHLFRKRESDDHDQAVS